MEKKELAIWITKFNWQENKKYNTAEMKMAVDCEDELVSSCLKEIDAKTVLELIDFKAGQFADVWSNVKFDWKFRKEFGNNELCVEAVMDLCE